MKDQLTGLWNTLPKWLRNPYIIAGIAFLLIILVLDVNNVFKLAERKKLYKDLKQEELYYQSENKRINEQKAALTNDPELLEKFAREEYMMKKDDEDIFIIEEE